LAVRWKAISLLEAAFYDFFYGLISILVVFANHAACFPYIVLTPMTLIY
jgi:hypothetical protein